MNRTASLKKDLVCEIVAAITNVVHFLKPGAATDGEWTAFLKAEMRRIGEKHDYLVLPTDTEPQWLYDLVWYRNSNAQLSEVCLVFESEWSRNLKYIQYDFEKLLVAKASIKVMVFQDYQSNLPDLWRMLKGGIAVFEQQRNSETYILAAFKEEDHEFEIQLA